MGRQWKVLLADDNKQFVNLLAERLTMEKDFDVVDVALDGEAALQGVWKHHPDLMVLDIIMPKLDGIAVLERLGEMPNRPKTVIFSAMGKDTITRRTLQLGANGYFVKPFDIAVLIRRLRTIMGESKQDQVSHDQLLAEDDLEQMVSHMLHMLAVPPHLLGYRYLKYAILSVTREQRMLENITYKLYPDIAAQFSTTPSRVERAMRNAIESAWNRCRVDTMEDLFGYSVDADRDKPSNSGFIALVADKVLLENKAMAQIQRRYAVGSYRSM